MTTTTKESRSNIQLQRWVAIASSILLLIKFAAYHITNSVAVLTDALESIVNVIAGFIGLFSLYISAKPRDVDHPYGHGKIEFVSAAIEGTLVLSAGLIIIYSAGRSFIYPSVVKKLDLGIYLIGGTAVINWVLGHISLKQGEKNNSLALIASGKHLQTDTLSTIAIIAGLILISTTGFLWIDGVIAIGFGMYIVYTGYKIVRASLAGIMDEADMDLLEKMVSIIGKNRQENWIDLHNLRVIKYGNVLHMDCHLTVPWYLNVHEAHAEIDELGKLVRSNFGEAIEFFVHNDGCLLFQCHICKKQDCPVRKHDFKKTIDWTLNNVLQNEKHSLKNLEA